MNNLLRLRNLRKSVEGRRLLDIRKLDIPEPACIVLSGRNGAGKSTLLRIIAGLELPDGGEVEYLGRSLPWRAARLAFRKDFVYLHQHPYMLNRSVRENVAFGLRRQGLCRSEVSERVEQALLWAGLSHLGARSARQLSGGEQQRVALTRARVLAPRLLLLDEPVANMDLESREQTFSLIERLKTDHISTIVTSHEPGVAERLGDLHLHLCKTGPCRYTLVNPFVYRGPLAQDFSMRTSREGQGAPALQPAPTNKVTTIMSNEKSPTATDAEACDPQVPRQAITAVVIAGGRAQRMGGRDKGLLPIDGRPMVAYIVEALKTQAGRILINANRNMGNYRRFGYPVIPDILGEYHGPLVGMASALQATDTEYLLTVPCDSPLLPAHLVDTLYRAMQRQGAEISVAHDGIRMQPVFALLRRHLLPSMLAYLRQGGRKIDTWYAQHDLAVADFSRFPEAFLNVNTPEEQADLERRMHAPGGG